MGGRAPFPRGMSTMQSLGTEHSSIVNYALTGFSSTACSGSTFATSYYHVIIPVDGSLACQTGSNLGFTYDSVSQSHSCTTVGTSSTTAPVYRLRKPSDNLPACSIPAGYTYDSATSTHTCSESTSTTTTALLYHLRVPTDGIYACSVPTGYTYDSSSASFTCSGASYSTTLFHLKKL